MLTGKHFQLSVLGQLALTAVDGEIATPIVARPRHLAVLAVLALARRPVDRERLVEMFWGGEPEERARHSLSNALSSLRRVLGSTAITARQDGVTLAGAQGARLAVDAVAFAGACEAREYERAVALYGGPFLERARVPDAPSFDAWVARERRRLEQLFLVACEDAAPALLRAGRFDAAAVLAERWLQAAPRSTVAFTTLLRAHAGADTAAARGAAHEAYRRGRAWLAEFGLRPDAQVEALAAELMERQTADDARLAASVAATPAVSASLTASPTAPPAAPPPAMATVPSAHAAPDVPSPEAPSRHVSPAVGPDRGLRSRAHRWRSLRRPIRAVFGGLAAAVVAVVALAVAATHGTRTGAAATITRPVIAVTPIENIRGDSALAWLQDGLAQIIAEDLAHSPSVDGVAPARVREVLDRRDVGHPAPLSPDALVDVAHRAGASWVVTGGLTAGRGLYVLDAEVRDVRTRSSVRSFTVLAGDPVRLGHLAAARLLDLAREVAGGRSDAASPRFADASDGTPPAAYEHLVRGLQLWQAGRHPDDARELDAAIALDSGLVGALVARRMVAAAHDEPALVARLSRVLARHRDRFTPWDSLTDELERATAAGENERAEALATRLLTRFPRDPRAYRRAGDLLVTHGRWAAADLVYGRALALDSLAMEVGAGPCAPCEGYGGLVGVRLMRGDLDGAEHAARRWVALQPNTARAWVALEAALSFSGRGDDAVAAGRRVLALTDDPNAREGYARTLIMARRWADAESLATVLAQSDLPASRTAAADLRVTLLRERGRYREALVTLRRAGPLLAGLGLVEADLLARTGRMREARVVWERAGHARVGAPPITDDASGARAYAWAHALEGDALARAGDMDGTRALADSVAQAGARSYYGRDWRLHHHLAGMFAAAHGDWDTAERELRAARWGVSGWTRTNVELARVQLAAGRPDDAVAVLRDAYAAPLDAMGRYVPRSELDWWMARALAAAGRMDSARTYADRVRTAWGDAEPEVRALLAALPAGAGERDLPVGTRRRAQERRDSVRRRS